jgi:hypothetical protein
MLLILIQFQAQVVPHHTGLQVATGTVKVISFSPGFSSPASNFSVRC